MNDHTADTVGVDISKARLDPHRLSTGEAARFANEPAGFADAGRGGGAAGRGREAGARNEVLTSISGTSPAVAAALPT